MQNATVELVKEESWELLGWLEHPKHGHASGRVEVHISDSGRVAVTSTFPLSVQIAVSERGICTVADRHEMVNLAYDIEAIIKRGVTLSPVSYVEYLSGIAHQAMLRGWTEYINATQVVGHPSREVKNGGEE